MIAQIAVNLEMFDSYQLQQEMNYLEKLGIGLSVIFIHVRDMLQKWKGAPLPTIPTQYVRETIYTSKVIVENVEFHYWNNLTDETSMTCQQYKDKILDSVIHHARLLYVDLWGLVVQFGIPLNRITNINRLPYGVFLDVTAT